MKLSICIDAIFTNHDFVEGMRKTKECGFEAFEFWSWWDKDITAIKKAKETLGLETAAFCTKPISLTDPAMRADYIRALIETIDAANKLNCRTIITQVGNELPGATRNCQRDSIIDGLAECAPLMQNAGITLVFEPLNTIIDHPGYFLWSTEEAFEIEKAVGSKHVKVLFDIYHQQLMEGNLINTIQSSVDKIGHFHCAGVPGRHELDLGELNYAGIFNAIRGTSFGGYVGLEYFPSFDPEPGLKKLAKQY